MARKLEISGDAHGLIASIAKQGHDPLGFHSILPAAGAAYASVYARMKGPSWKASSLLRAATAGARFPHCRDAPWGVS
jgi:hypothetical protein